ncbi:MAG: hypothetical protein WDZ85_00525 [Candidatus Paceibacterota bacterium]
MNKIISNNNLLAGILLFATMAYLTNFFWESWHAVYFYTGHLGRSFADWPIPDYVRLITYVSTVDIIILLTILLGGTLVWREADWFMTMTWSKYVYFIMFALTVAVWIEIKGVYLFSQWSYLPTMPTVFGLGLSPLIQLPLTGLVSLYFLRLIRDNNAG